MNPFIPTDCPFEILGFCEDLVDIREMKYLGSRDIAEPDRPCGSDGLTVHTITEPLTLKRGHKTVTVKASPQRPLVVMGTIQILCGRVKK